MELNCR